MTLRELALLVCSGRIILVGEVRAATVDRTGYVDTKTGLAAQLLMITYFVELRGKGEFELVKIRRRAPAEITDPAGVCTGVEKGRVYAFRVDSLERKNGFVSARMSVVWPELVDMEEPATQSAPAGAPAAALNLVYSQTTPQPL